MGNSHGRGHTACVEAMTGASYSRTLFQAASVSKPVSALGALLLVQQQRLELDADVRPWLRAWMPGETITLRQLLSHTAGLTVSGFSGYAPGMSLPSVAQILNGRPPGQQRAGGREQWR